MRPSGSKYWFRRGTVKGKRMDLRVGAYPYVTLAEARDTAFRYRKAAKAGRDPRPEAPGLDEAGRARSSRRWSRPSWRWPPPPHNPRYVLGHYTICVMTLH